MAPLLGAAVTGRSAVALPTAWATTREALTEGRTERLGATASCLELTRKAAAALKARLLPVALLEEATGARIWTCIVCDCKDSLKVKSEMEIRGSNESVMMTQRNNLAPGPN